MEETPALPVQLSVSIVLYNTPEVMLRRVLLSLQRSAEQAQASLNLGAVSVCLVDNSPGPQTRQVLRQLTLDWPDSDHIHLEYRPLPHNPGFGAGHNEALLDQRSDYHLVLNPDAELAVDALTVGLSRLRDDPAIVVLSPRVTAEDGSQEFLCKRYPSAWVLLLRAFAPGFMQQLFRHRLADYEMRDACAGDQEVDVLLASGCFMLVPTAALRAVGGFNDDYFLYFEDFDLSLRLAEHGRLVFSPAMHIVHHGGYAASKGLRHVRYFIRSGITFFNQHGWRWI